MSHLVCCIPLPTFLKWQSVSETAVSQTLQGHSQSSYIAWLTAVIPNISNNNWAELLNNPVCLYHQSNKTRTCFSSLFYLGVLINVVEVIMLICNVGTAAPYRILLILVSIMLLCVQ